MSEPAPKKERRGGRRRTTRHGNGWGQGPGWGGPAKGVGRGSAPKLIPGLTASRGAAAATNREAREARSEELQALLFGLALDERVNSMTRVNAASRLLDILEGPPRPGGYLGRT